jgi:hypothetical protein
MNEESGKKLPDHLQAKCDSLAAGTVLVPPTDDSDVTDVEFNDPKLMGADLDENITNFIAGYPYVGFRWICRKLNLTPAETLKQITPYLTLVENCSWTPEQVKESLISEVESLTAEGWEPGVRPEPPTPEQLRDMVRDHFKPELRMLMDMSVADLVYRSGSNFQDVIACMVDVAVGNTLARFKYITTDPNTDECKWLLSPLELAEAAAGCRWIAGAREEAAKAKEGK